MTDAYAHVWKTSDFPLILKLPVDNPFPSHSPFHNGMTFLKGPKHEIFESGFLWLGDLGTAKKMEISKVGVIILRFSLRNSY